MVHEIFVKEVTIYFFEMELGLDICQPISMVEVLGGTGRSLGEAFIAAEDLDKLIMMTMIR